MHLRRVEANMSCSRWSKLVVPHSGAPLALDSFFSDLFAVQRPLISFIGKLRG